MIGTKRETTVVISERSKTIMTIMCLSADKAADGFKGTVSRDFRLLVFFMNQCDIRTEPKFIDILWELKSAMAWGSSQLRLGVVS
jgi:hypothetical protein